MRRALGTALVTVVVVLAPFALACKESPLPGQAVGTFAVHGSLEENGCLPGFAPLDPIDFTVDIRRDHGTLSWRMAGGPPNTGSLSADGSFRLQSRSQIEAWPADPLNGIVGCSLTQIETIDGTLGMPVRPDAGAVDGSSDAGVGADAGAQLGDAGDAGVSLVASFTADNEVQIVPVLGSDCSALLISNGGSFPALPCSARYLLTGVLAD